MQKITCILKFTQFVGLTALPLTNSLHFVAACRNKSGEGGNCVLEFTGFLPCIHIHIFLFLTGITQKPKNDLNNGQDGDPKEDSKPAGHVHQDLGQSSFQIPFVL